MDKSNRVALRMVGLTMVLVLLGVAKVNNDFNRIVQPSKPVTLVGLRTELSSRVKELPLTELNAILRAFPLQQVKSGFLEVGMESRQKLLFWWEEMVKPPSNAVASKKR